MCIRDRDALSCAAITRTPSGLISRINAQLQNIGAIDGVKFETAAVPETATWAMMLVGFGALGASMRVRRRVNLHLA